MSINDFINASNNGNLDLVKQILSSNEIDVNSKNIYIVNIHDIQFFFIHDIKKCKHLWNLSSTFNDTALILSSSSGHINIVQLLLTQKNIDINMEGILIQKNL